MPPRRFNPGAIDDLSDVVEERISKKVKEDFRSQMEEVKVNFRSEMALMKSDMITKIVSALGGLPRHVAAEDGYEKVVEDFKVSRLSGEDKIDHVERPMGNRASQFVRFGSQLKLKHKIEISNFSCTLNPEDIIDSIGELED